MLPFVDRLLGRDPAHVLRIPRREEFEGMLLLGDPGTGKSQIIHQLIGQIRMRTPAEAGVCFDPACEFLEAHFDPKTDVVLNPLDARFPYWSPSLEVESEIDLQLVSESFLPYHERMSETNRFFVDASRDIFELMLARGPTASTIVEWLSDEKRIDELAEGTEVAHKISRKAGPQRVAVLSTLAKVGKLLRMLPAHEEGMPRLSLSRWAQRRRGWIFITSTQETRDALRPLQAAFLNILMKRLLSAAREWGQAHPCWMIVDEVHALGHLSMLPTFIAESRKYGLKPVFGTQSKHQFQHHYGEDARAMLAAPHLKLFLRCNESEAAQWVADNIGEEERERPRVGTTSDVRAGGRGSVNYSTAVERRSVVSKEQVMSLANLHGYWKYGGRVVPFRIGVRAWPQVAAGFKPRPVRSRKDQSALAVSPKPSPTPPAVPPQQQQQPAQSNFPSSNERPASSLVPARPGRRRIELPDDELDLNF